MAKSSLGSRFLNVPHVSDWSPGGGGLEAMQRGVCCDRCRVDVASMKVRDQNQSRLDLESTSWSPSVVEIACHVERSWTYSTRSTKRGNPRSEGTSCRFRLTPQRSDINTDASSSGATHSHPPPLFR